MSSGPVSHPHTEINTAVAFTQLLIASTKYPTYPFFFVQRLVWLLATLDLLCGEMIQQSPYTYAP